MVDDQHHQSQQSSDTANEKSEIVVGVIGSRLRPFDMLIVCHV